MSATTNAVEGTCKLEDLRFQGFLLFPTGRTERHFFEVDSVSLMEGGVIPRYIPFQRSLFRL
jgi:hypothetical protein